MTERSPDALGRSILVNANALQGTPHEDKEGRYNLMEAITAATNALVAQAKRGLATRGGDLAAPAPAQPAAVAPPSTTAEAPEAALGRGKDVPGRKRKPEAAQVAVPDAAAPRVAAPAPVQEGQLKPSPPLLPPARTPAGDRVVTFAPADAPVSGPTNSPVPGAGIRRDRDLSGPQRGGSVAAMQAKDSAAAAAAATVAPGAPEVSNSAAAKKKKVAAREDSEQLIIIKRPPAAKTPGHGATQGKGGGPKGPAARPAVDAARTGGEESDSGSESGEEPGLTLTEARTLHKFVDKITDVAGGGSILKMMTDDGEFGTVYPKIRLALKMEACGYRSVMEALQDTALDLCIIATKKRATQQRQIEAAETAAGMVKRFHELAEKMFPSEYHEANRFEMALAGFQSPAGGGVKKPAGGNLGRPNGTPVPAGGAARGGGADGAWASPPTAGGRAKAQQQRASAGASGGVKAGAPPGGRAADLAPAGAPANKRARTEGRSGPLREGLVGDGDAPSEDATDGEEEGRGEEDAARRHSRGGGGGGGGWRAARGAPVDDFTFIPGADGNNDDDDDTRLGGKLLTGNKNSRRGE